MPDDSEGRRVVFEVPSFTDPTKSYVVRRLPSGQWACLCPAYEYQKKGSCKHTKVLEEAGLLW